MARRKRSVLLIGLVVGLLLVVLMGIVVVVGLQMVSISNRIEKRDESLMSAVRDNTSSMDFLRQNLMLLAQDSNSERDALKLPPRDYPILHQAETAASSPSTDSRDLFMAGLDSLLRERDQRIMKERFAQITSSSELLGLEAREDLKTEQIGGDTLALTRNGQTYFTLTIDPVSRGLHITDYLGKEALSKTFDSRVVGFIQSRTPLLSEHFRKLDSSLAVFEKTSAEPEIRSFLQKNDLTTTKPHQSVLGYTMQVERAGNVLLTVTLDPRSLAVSVGEHRYAGVADFAAAFAGDLKRLDLAQLADERVARARQSIEALHNDKSFMIALSSRKIRFARTPREDIDYYYYDFTDPDGNRIGSFAVQKQLGTIYLMDSQDVPISALKTLTLPVAEPSKKKLAPISRQPAATGREIAGAGGSIDFLVCGAHQNETDTIVVVHADRATGRVILISVPRDLYYKGRKINAVYQLYGPAELAQEVAQITGLPIRKYVVIDMYAFIDAINIIGGIDLRLSAPLVDPTYRVRNNGEWTTLSYAPGIHHLDGIEALRIARSRHTTSDFARAYRQQDILAAIRDKIEKTDPLDVSKLYNLVGVFLRYVDTNFSPAEIVDTFLSYKDLPISGHYVIDTANVLYQTYSNIYYLGDNGKQVSASFDKGAWIVLPQGDDWNVIRRYVAGIIGGDTP